jgi:hypothetical protein
MNIPAADLPTVMLWQTGQRGTNKEEVFLIASRDYILNSFILICCPARPVRLGYRDYEAA